MRLDFDSSIPRSVQLLRLARVRKPGGKQVKQSGKAKALTQRGRFCTLVSAYWRGELDSYRARA